jgi:hypothetical protein
MNLFKSREAVDLDASAKTDGVGDIREFIRRDFASVRRPTENEGEMVANNISSLLQRVSGSSVQEIDRLIGELQTARDTLQNEGERVQREIIQYANLSQAAMRSTKIIAESLTNWQASAHQ